MRRRGPLLLGLGVLALGLVAVALAVLATSDDGRAGSEPWDPVPVSDEPSPASPREQDAAEAQIVAGLTLDDLVNATPSEVTPPRPPAEPSEDLDVPEGGVTEAHAPSAPSPSVAGDVGSATTCVRNPKQIPARSGYAYVRGCLRAGYESLPLQAIGVMYRSIRYPDGTKGVSEHCTASVASTRTSESRGNGSVLVTAGHCLGSLENGVWQPYRDLFWIPAVAHRILYTEGVGDSEIRAFMNRWAWFPKLTSAGNPVALIPRRFKDTYNEEYDFAAVIMAPHGTGTILDDRGGVGVEMQGRAAGQSIRSYGNPASYQFVGDQMFVCAGTSRRGDAAVYKRARMAVVGIGCDMTGGSSGGPWLAFTSPTEDEALVSLTSYGFARCAANAREASGYRRQGYDVPLCASRECRRFCAPQSKDNLMFGPILDGKHWPSFDQARTTATS